MSISCRNSFSPLAMLLAGCIVLSNIAVAREQADAMYVVLGENGMPVARVVTAAR